jgi:hypothetical protein
MKKLFILLFILPCFLLTACTDESSTPSSPSLGTEESIEELYYDLTDEECAECYDRYLDGWGLGSPFMTEFDEETFSDINYFLYLNSLIQEDIWYEYEELYGDVFSGVPAEAVEAVVTRHFPITAEEFRDTFPYSDNAFVYYDSGTDTYIMEETGIGGVGCYGVVIQGRREGDLLVLTCLWYDAADNSFVYDHIVTIRLGEAENEFMYISNIIPVG